jgi:hypothetical protein
MAPLECAAGDGYNRTVPEAEVLPKLGFDFPLQIFPGATFRYRTCAANGSVAYMRADLMPVPSPTSANASAYAMHSWVKVRHRVDPSVLLPPRLCAHHIRK